MLLENAEIANMAVWLASDQSTYGTAITYFLRRRHHARQRRPLTPEDGSGRHETGVGQFPSSRWVATLELCQEESGEGS